MDDMQEMIAEFIVDCSENLEEFENSLLDLERDPNAPGVVDSMFRMIHSIKGASGFLSFSNLESLTHKAENVLDLLRQAKGSVDQSLISTFLDVCDAMRTMFDVIQEEGNDGQNKYEDLVNKLLDYEKNFKEGTASVEDTLAKENTSELSCDHNDEKLELDPVQIEALKSLGMYNEDEVKAKEETKEIEDTEEEKLELDPVQIEALKSLGMYNENEVKTKASETSSIKEPETKLENETQKNTKKPETKKTTAVKETIRVDVDTLDKLVNLAGELVLVRNQLLELSKFNNSEIYDASFASLDMVTGEIQRSLMTTRMQPISTVWNKMPRIVRDLAAQLNKDIEIQMQGENNELDKTIIEAIADPMTHIIRNCCDHGIEMPDDREKAGKPRKGTIKLIAEHKGNWIHVDVIDDGKGIPKEVLKRKAVEKGIYSQEEVDNLDDQQVLNIIFHPGFSTKDQASNISGRGVGMDVIKQNIMKINGTVEIFSTEDKGTTLKIKLPLTLAIIPAVIVSIDNVKYAIPQNSVQEVASVSKEEIQKMDDIGGQRFTRLRGQILPLVFASEFLGTKNRDREDQTSKEYTNLNYVVIYADGYRYGLVIDKVLDIIEIVVKPLDSDRDFEYYAGATIMGDGKVALILEATKIAELSKIDQLKIEDTTQQDSQFSSNTSTLTLLFKLRDGKNYLIPLSKTSRIEEIDRKNIEERQIGTFAKFNGNIIRVIDLMSLLNLYPNPEFDHVTQSHTVKTLYSELGGHGIAIDIGFDHTLLQEDYHVEETNNSEFIVGTALINDTVYEVLELEDYLGSVVGESSTATSLNQDASLEEYEDKKNIVDLYDAQSSVISFAIGNLKFGIALDSIKEIIATEEVTSTPGSRDSVKGLLNLRGDIMVTRSLPDILMLENETSQTDSNRSLIIQDGEDKLCLQIGKVDEILNLNQADYTNAPNNIPQNILNYLKGVYNYCDNMLLLVDVKKLITDIKVES